MGGFQPHFSKVAALQDFTQKKISQTSQSLSHAFSWKARFFLDFFGEKLRTTILQNTSASPFSSNHLFLDSFKLLVNFKIPFFFAITWRETKNQKTKVRVAQCFLRLLWKISNNEQDNLLQQTPPQTLT